MKKSVQIAYDTCRTIGHAWFPVAVTHEVLFGTPMQFHCERCDMERVDIINNRGDLGQRRYIAPPGYKRSEKLTRAEYRLLLLEHSKKPKR